MREKPDSEVEQWVLRELNLSDKARSREVCVLARDGLVRLRGSAQSDEDRLAVEAAVRHAIGVVSVVNEIKVIPCTALIDPSPKSVALIRASGPATLLNRLAASHSVAKAATP